MSPTSYQAALSRVALSSITLISGSGKGKMNFFFNWLKPLLLLGFLDWGGWGWGGARSPTAGAKPIAKVIE
ncbi:MAG TPA: hypothetical protein DEA78_11600 [Cyanobacteria bacterium UBA11159]|nr:hypothetical protein [Cyanobacteria bacterium UBA11159]